MENFRFAYHCPPKIGIDLTPLCSIKIMPMLKARLKQYTLFLIIGWLFITQTAIAQEPTPPILFSGTVVDDLGRALPEAQVQFWQTDAYGYYNHPAAPNTALRDPNFQFFGTDTTDSNGNFAFKTVRPGIYPGRPSHIHFKVWLGGVELLTSQFYFADENVAVSELLILELVEGTDSDGTRALLTTKNITINMGGGGSLPITPAQAEGPFYPVVDFFGYDNDLTTIEMPSAVTIRQQQTTTSHTLLISFLGLLFTTLSWRAINLQRNCSPMTKNAPQ